MNAITQQISELTETAIHESGHAVVSAELSRCLSADVIATEDRSGVCNHRAAANPVHAVAIALGGAVAAWEFRRRRGEKYGYKASGDLQQVDKLLSKLHGMEISGDRRECFPEFALGQNMAKRIVGEQWGAILRCAEWLLENKKISGRLVHACLSVHKTGE